MNNLLAKLQVGYESGVPVMIWGVPGVGKTQVAKTWANKVLNMRMITLHLAQMEAPDLLGLPKALKKNGFNHDTDGNVHVMATEADFEHWQTHYIRPAWWPDDPVILFLDELNRAQRFEINAIHQLVVDLCLFMNKLPKGSYIISACNPQTQEEIGLTPFGDAFWDRWSHIQAKTSSDAWLKWAKTAAVETAVYDFIDSRPDTDKVTTLNARTMNFGEILKNVHPTPRSWESVSKVLVACEKLGGQFLEIAGWPLIEGLVGGTMAQTFRSFHASSDKPIDPRELMAYNQRQIPNDPKHPDRGTRLSNSRDDFSPERISKKVRDKAEEWGRRSGNKIALLKSTIQSSQDAVLAVYLKNGGKDFYTKNQTLIQEHFGNLWEFITICPPSLQAAFLQESATDEWSNIVSLIPFFYLDKWLNDLPKGFDFGNAK